MIILEFKNQKNNNFKNMTVIKTQIKTYRIDKVCPECEKGFLVATGNAGYRFDFHVKEEHRCDNCGHKAYFWDKKYPHEVIESIGRRKKIKERDNTLVDEEIIINGINYHNMCAKATLGEVPIVTLESFAKATGIKITTCPDCQGEGYTRFTDQGEPDIICKTCEGVGKLKVK